MVKTFKASEFKASALAIMRTVHETGEAVMVTNHGKPLVRIESARDEELSGYGCMAATCTLAASDDDIVHFGSGDWGTLAKWDSVSAKGKRRR